MPLPRLTPLLACLLAGTACAQTTAPPSGAFRILFIGNSLTASNNLPAMVEALGESAGVDVGVREVTIGGASLEDHWNAGTARDVIRNGGPWNMVVMQQGPSGQPASRVNLVEWAGRFGTEIRDAGAVPVMYMVWPDASRLTAFDSVSGSYRAAAVAAGGPVAPAGDAWTAAWQQNSALALYGPDDFHPSVTGTFLAALTISTVVYGRPVTAFPARIRAGNTTIEIDAATAAILRTAVTQSLTTTP